MARLRWRRASSSRRYAATGLVEIDRVLSQYSAPAEIAADLLRQPLGSRSSPFSFSSPRLSAARSSAISAFPARRQRAAAPRPGTRRLADDRHGAALGDRKVGEVEGHLALEQPLLYPARAAYRYHSRRSVPVSPRAAWTRIGSPFSVPSSTVSRLSICCSFFISTPFLSLLISFFSSPSVALIYLSISSSFVASATRRRSPTPTARWSRSSAPVTALPALSAFSSPSRSSLWVVFYLQLTVIALAFSLYGLPYLVGGHQQLGARSSSSVPASVSFTRCVRPPAAARSAASDSSILILLLSADALHAGSPRPR